MKNGDVLVVRHLRRRDEIPEGWHELPQDVANYHAQFSLLIAKDDMSEPLPDDNPKTIHGAAKPGIHCIPPSALLHLGQAMFDGKEKYGLMNWRQDRVSASTYYNAAVARHFPAWWDGEDYAQDSMVHHLAHVMACCAILIDAMEMGMLNDDRPVKGSLPDIIKRMTKEITA